MFDHIRCVLLLILNKVLLILHQLYEAVRTEVFTRRPCAFCEVAHVAAGATVSGADAPWSNLCCVGFAAVVSATRFRLLDHLPTQPL